MSLIRYDQIAIVSSYTDFASMSANAGQLGIDISSFMTYRYDGTNWIPINRDVVKKSTVTINAKNTGATRIYTLESNPFNFYPIFVIPRAVNISGVTTAPTLSIGSNGTSYNNIAASSLLSTVLSALSVGSGAPTAASYSPALAGGTDIYVNVTTGAIATNYSVSYDILGYYY